MITMQTDEILSRRTELVLKELDQLPTLPAVAARLLELASRDDVEVREIVRVIEADPTVTARLLALCRRAAYRTRAPITTVEMAVVMLGIEAVRSLALSVEIFDWCERAGEAYRRPGAVGTATARGRASTKPAGTSAADSKASFNRVGFWQHSIAVACCADLIAREHPELDLHPEECFVAGLVHDLGKVALELVLPKAYARVVELADVRQGNIADFERPIVGLDHHAAGATIAQRWGLPGLLQAAMSLHHLSYRQILDRVSEPAWARVVSVVNLSDVLCRRLSLGWSGNLVQAVDDAALCAEAGLRIERVQGVVGKLYEATSQRMRDLGLGDEPSQQLLIESILRANHRLGRANTELNELNRKLELAQQQLTEARVMARLGAMTAGAAHEMNTPLAIISGRAQGLLVRQREDSDRISVRAIIDASARLSDLITRLNRIASPPEPQPSIIDVRATMESIIKSAKDAHGDRVQARGEPLSVLGIKLTIADGIDTARLDTAMLSEALVEIIVNALEAKPRSRVAVSVDEDRSWQALIITVSDDGVGMSQHAAEHAIDPFFSDKPAGRQSGLGLALAHRLIAAQGGEIELSSKPGRGTNVSVRLLNWRTDIPKPTSRSAA